MGERGYCGWCLQQFFSPFVASALNFVNPGNRSHVARTGSESPHSHTHDSNNGFFRDDLPIHYVLPWPIRGFFYLLGNFGNFGHDDLLDWEKTAMAQLSLITGFREPQDVYIKAYNGLSQSCWIMLCCY